MTVSRTLHQRNLGVLDDRQAGSYGEDRNPIWDRYERSKIWDDMSENPLEISDCDAIGQLNAVRYIDLRDISEPNKRVFNSLRIVVEQAVVNEAAVVVSDRPELASLLTGAHPIESVDGCKTFQLSWKNYLAYLVTEELVGSNAPNGYADEVYTGRILRVYTRSHFLDHVMRDTGGHIQEILHYKLICLNHLIDVVSYDPPEVEVLQHGEDFSNREEWLH
jgi:hypothetical protein